jgi:hypothetical protein
MSNGIETLPFSTAKIQFEPFTGYVGIASEAIPEPITAFFIDALIQASPGTAEIREAYFLRVIDEAAPHPAPQDVMVSSDFGQVAKLSAAVFACCNHPGDTARVGYGFHAYHNALAHSLNPSLPDLPVHKLECSVRGQADWGVAIEFSTADDNPCVITAIHGRLMPKGLHGLASGVRDLAVWRHEALDAAVALLASAERAGQPGAWQARQAAAPEDPGPAFRR